MDSMIKILLNNVNYDNVKHKILSIYLSYKVKDWLKKYDVN